MKQNLSSFKIKGVYTTHTKIYPVLLELSDLSHLFIMKHHSLTTIYLLALFEQEETIQRHTSPKLWLLEFGYHLHFLKTLSSMKNVYK